jgi:hypothetical protein
MYTYARYAHLHRVAEYSCRIGFKRRGKNLSVTMSVRAFASRRVPAKNTREKEGGRGEPKKPEVNFQIEEAFFSKCCDNRQQQNTCRGIKPSAPQAPIVVASSIQLAPCSGNIMAIHLCLRHRC